MQCSHIQAQDKLSHRHPFHAPSHNLVLQKLCILFQRCHGMWLQTSRYHCAHMSTSQTTVLLDGCRNKLPEYLHGPHLEAFPSQFELILGVAVRLHMTIPFKLQAENCLPGLFICRLGFFFAACSHRSHRTDKVAAEDFALSRFISVVTATSYLLRAACRF